MDLRLRYARRKACQEKLAQKYGWDCFIVHLASGRVSAATVELAAQLITDDHHREATPDEVAAYQIEQQRESSRIAATSRRLARTNYRPGGKRPDPNRRVYEFI
jgi:hypothetical protein